MRALPIPLALLYSALLYAALHCFTLCFTLITLLYSALLCVEQAFEHFLKLFPEALESEEEDKDSHSEAVLL
jgi:hypothetical protein